MNVAWRHYQLGMAGIARGYLSAQFYLYNALRRMLGPHFVDALDVAAHPRVHLHMVPPHLFQPVPNRINVLFSMWEGEVLPEYEVNALKLADLLVVPSHFCQRVWNAHGFHAFVVPLGVPDAYVASDTARPVILHERRRLRVLAVGSMVSRKGWPLLAQAWEETFTPQSGVQMYVKTITDEPQVKSGYNGSIVMDTRDLEPADMLKLYQSSDVIVSASYGEGFGLPVLEGMATGCLAVAPAYGGLAEFVGDNTAVVVPRSATGTVTYGEEFASALATPADLGKALKRAVTGWGTPEIEQRRRMGSVCAKDFTWTMTALRLLASLRAAGVLEVPEDMVPARLDPPTMRNFLAAGV